MMISQIPYFVILLTPLSYTQSFGIRTLLIQLILLLLVVMTHPSWRIHAGASTLSMTFLFTYVLVISGLGQTYQFLGALLAFFILAYWPVFANAQYVRYRISVNRLSFCYLIAALLTATGVLLQAAIHKHYGIALGKIDLYGERTAYGFLWDDYSFLSLYLASAVPLAYGRTSKATFPVCSTLLIVASLATTARTGMVALVAACLLVAGIYALHSLHTAYLTRKRLVLIVSLVVLVLISPVLWQLIAQRELEFGGSGRLADYSHAVGFLFDNLLLGAKYDLGWYRKEIGLFPHNMFLFIAATGGFVALLLFLSWIIITFITIHKIDARLLLSIFIVIIGMQFIPSFFSAYFLGTLLSISLIDHIKQKEPKNLGAPNNPECLTL